MTAPRLKIVRTSELAAFERLGWVRLGPHGDAFDLVEWRGAGEPVLPDLPVFRPLRRHRMRMTG